MSRIFTVLVDWWMRKAHYPPAVTKLRSPMVFATLDIYQVRRHCRFLFSTTLGSRIRFCSAVSSAFRRCHRLCFQCRHVHCCIRKDLALQVKYGFELRFSSRMSSC
jgi:hypothetical protein